jgi:ubiquinone/menaquinone biosynthesis C-methylase UbiE
MDVLDVACGTGRWLEELWQRGAASAVGLDVSTEMLRQARGKAALASRVVQADAMDMPLRSKSPGLRHLFIRVELHGRHRTVREGAFKGAQARRLFRLNGLAS